MINKIILISGILIPLISFSQNEIDALRYSNLQFGGTSRYNGMAGAFGALGADMSAASVNPAGMARFNRSEISITPGFTDFNTDAEYNLNTTFNGDVRLNMSNFGYVGSIQLPKDNFNKWKSLQFGITYNKLAIFNQSSRITGENVNSMLSTFALFARGLSSDAIADALPYTSELAWQTFTIDPHPTILNEYVHPMRYGNVFQSRTLERKGGYNETAFTFSGNYDNRIYLGGSIGIPNVRFSEEYTHYERALFDTTATLIDDFTYSYSQTTSGTGLNAKLGVIFLPVDFIRVGFAAHTRTRIGLSDQWSTTMRSNFKDDSSYFEASPIGNYSYVVTTPGRFIFSLAGIIAKKGVISTDIEYVNYANARLRSRSFSGNNYSFANENDAVSTIYTSAINLRVGGEFRLQKFFIRGGYARNGSPFNTKSNPDLVENSGARSTYTLGFGFRNRSFYADAAYMLSVWKEDYYLYDPAITNPATLNNNISNITFTVGFRY